jgi:hypothetical protein
MRWHFFECFASLWKPFWYLLSHLFASLKLFFKFCSTQLKILMWNHCFNSWQLCTVVLTMNSKTKSIKSPTKPIKIQIFFVILFVLFVILFILFVNSLLKRAHSCQPWKQWFHMIIFKCVVLDIAAKQVGYAHKLLLFSKLYN